jgi:membrane protease YdiL (CAAX protease family)
MSADPTVSRSIGFWRTVALLLTAARRRSRGRFQRQQQLLNNRTGSSTNTLGALSVLVVWALMAALNGGAAYVLYETVSIAQDLETETHGKIIVSSFFLERLRALESAQSEIEKTEAQENLERAYDIERYTRAGEYHQAPEQAETFLRNAVNNRQSSDFVTRPSTNGVFERLRDYGPVPAMLGTLVLLWWLIMLVFQGEGLELDLQRRRHPMWEWLFTHPVKPGAVFLAEMLSPIAANPIYVTAPLFFAVLYAFVYDVSTGAAAMFLTGVPVAIATAGAGKALEIGVILRFAPRSRGALIGFMTWLGYVGMMAFLFVAVALATVVPTVAGLLRPLATLVPWPFMSWAIGLRPDGSLSFLWGMLAWWLFSAIVIAGGVRFTVWGAQRGLAGATETKPASSAKSIFRLPLLSKEPLYRKEVMWFLRDRGAIVQTILVPATIASFQLFNLRGLARGVQGSSLYLSGAAVIFGTYFLWILGPRSLASEGPALWLAQTWPRGLEELMKAKARLWFTLANALVTLVLIYALVRYPSDWWKIVLVGIGWFAFGRSMAAKSVTLVTISSSSGEPEPIPKGRRWAASLGMLTFSIGILSHNWSLAVVGIVYSWLTAAAMWENFRARLPYLFDPWSEKVPPPPTLLHAMIAISALAEGGSVISGIFMIVAGRVGGLELMSIVQAIAFGAVAAIVWFVTSTVLGNRGLNNRDVWNWRGPQQATVWRGRPDKDYDKHFFGSLAVGAACGLVLGFLSVGYVWVLSRFGPFTELFRGAEEQAKEIPNLVTGLFIVGVFFAPFAEEYLFRGLLFRALDRAWGGWRALLGSAMFFAIYHQPASWLPVGLVGAASAVIFKKTGRLTSAVALHMVYNAVVIGSMKV